MKKWWVIALASLLIVTAVVTSFLHKASSKRMPVYQGKTARDWLGEMSGPNQAAAFAAFSSMGSNALPAIVDGYRRRDSSWTRFYQRNYPELSPFWKQHLPAPKPVSEIWSAASWAMVMVPNAREALPELMRMLAATNNPARIQILLAASIRFGPEDNAYVPALIPFLQDSDASARMFAMQGLERIGPNAVPALVKVIESGNPQLHERALTSLKKIDPDAAAKYEHP